MVRPANWLLAGADDSPALIDSGSGDRVSYRQLRAMVDRRGEQLSHLSGGIVVFGIGNSVPSVVDYLALVSSGATVLLVDPESSADSLRGWIDAYRPDAVLGVRGAEDRAVSVAQAPRPETVLLPTSGSTGSPKFVRLSMTNLAANARQIVGALRIETEHRSLVHLPLFYSYGLSVLHSHLSAGASLVLTQSSAVRPEFWNALAEHRVTSLPGVPYSYEMFRRMDIAGRDLPHLRDLTQAGGRMAPERIREFHDFCASTGRRLWVMYGQTEATARISVLPYDRLSERIGSVGRAVEGTTVRIDEPSGDGVGELIVSGPQVMLGYASGRDDIDGSDTCGGVLRTGDLARIDDGWITITGRVSRIAKIYGARISLDDVEERLSGFGRIAAVGSGDSVTVFLETRDDIDSNVVVRSMERTLGVPVKALSLCIVDALPRTASGKVDYRALEQSCR